MKKLMRYAVLLLAALIMAMPMTVMAADDVPMDVTSSSTMVPVTVKGVQDYTMASDLFDLINEYRVENGLEELVLCSDYIDYAETRSRELVIRGGHTRPNGQYYAFDFDDVGYAPTEQCSITDNGTAQHLLEMIKNDYAHDVDIKDPAHKAISIAVFHDTRNGCTYMNLQQSDHEASMPCEKRYGESQVEVAISVPAEKIIPRIVAYAIGTYPEKYELHVESSNIASNRFLYYLDNSNFEFISSDESKFTVDEEGKITAISEGPAVLRYVFKATGAEYSVNLYINHIPFTGDYTDVEMWLDCETVEYAGRAVEPSVTVVRGDNVLQKDIDYTLTYSNNDGIGTGNVTVAGIGMCTGTRTLSFEIVPKAIDSCTVEGLDGTFTFAGADIEPAITVRDGETVLEEGVDYAVSFSSNRDAGEATVLVEGLGGYSGTVTKTFSIVPKGLGEASLSFKESEFWKTGEPVEPEFDVVLPGYELEKDRDFTVSYTNNVEPGTADVTVTGIGNFTGTTGATFELQAKVLSEEASFGGMLESYPYIGDSVEPSFWLETETGARLEKDVDYTVAYANNVEPGEGSIIVTGIGRYVGEMTASFTIRRMNINEASVEGLKGTYEYTGMPVEPEFRLYYDNYTLIPDTDYTMVLSSNTEVGTGSITLTAGGCWDGERVLTFEIVDYPLPAAPTGLKAQNTSAGIRLTWDTVEDASHYAVYRKTGDEDWTQVMLADGGTPYATDGTAEPGILYQYSVTSVAEHEDEITKESGYGTAVSMLYVERVSSVKTTAGTRTIKVTWPLVEGATGYVVYRNNAHVASLDSSADSWTDSSVSSGKKYQYCVKAVQALNGTTYEASISATATRYFLAKPAVTSVKNYSSGMYVTWRKVSGASGYIIYRNGKIAKTITSGSTFTWKDSKADTNARKYTYTVQAYKKVGNATYRSVNSSKAVNYFVKKPKISSVKKSGSGVKIKWKKVSGASGYIIYRDGKKAKTIKSGKTVSWKDKKASKTGKKYTYKIVAYKKVGGKVYKSVVSSTKSVRR